MTMNSNHFACPKSIVLLKQKYKMMITATFTKLLLIRIVARRRSLSLSRDATFPSAGCLLSSIVLLSFGLRLKNAISLAETKPEHRSRIKTIPKAIQTLEELGM